MRRLGPLLALCWATPAGARCPGDPVPAGVLASNRVELAFSTGNPVEFEEARADLARLIPCFDRPVLPQEVPPIHRAMALAAFAEGNRGAARRSWAAVRALDPDWVPSFTLTHRRDPVVDAWKDSAAYRPGYAPLPEILPTAWTVDGAPIAAAPSDRAFILQAFDGHLRGRYAGYHTDVSTVPAEVWDGGPEAWALAAVTGGGITALAGGVVAALNVAQGTRAAELAGDATTTAAYDAAVARRDAAARGATAGFVVAGLGSGLVVAGVVGVVAGERR